jgi:hypothetical protein
MCPFRMPIALLRAIIEQLSERPGFFLKWSGFYTMITNMEERIGSVIRFFDKSTVAAVKLDFGELAVGDIIHIKGNSTDFTQKIEAMEFNHQPVQKAVRGQFTGIKLAQPAKPFDLVYKVTG